MKRMVLAVAVILTLGPAALSQVGAAAASDQTAARVDALFAKWNKADSPGCALAVIKEGRIIYERGYGMANLEYDTPITPSSVFYAGSVSKQFAAMSIALLARLCSGAGLSFAANAGIALQSTAVGGAGPSVRQWPSLSRQRLGP